VEAIEVLQKRIDEINSKIMEIDTEINVLKKKEDELIEKKDHLSEEYAQALAELKTIERESETIPARIKAIERELNALDPEIKASRDEIEKFIIFLKKINQLPKNENIETLLIDNILKPAEKLVETLDLEQLYSNLISEERKVERYRRLVLDAERHIENIEKLKKKVKEIRDEIHRIDKEMEEIKKFYDEELKTLFSEIRRRLKIINSAYKEIISLLGYDGWIALRKDKNDDLILEVTININRDKPVELEKGGFSSGEKTLSIMALIIAILKSTPSPIYIFDEFDVFLDDKSLNDVMKLIKTFLKDFQGIITTTHREQLIENADKIFYLSYDENEKMTKIVDVTIREMLRRYQ